MRDRHLDNKRHLEYIATAIVDIEKFVTGKGLEVFLYDKMLHDAVLLQFIIIGESIIHIEQELLDRYNYPWYRVRSFRNMIAHEYFNIKLEQVWDTIQIEIPKLKVFINLIIKKEFPK